ncbi:hypothetical protein CXF68_04690 [Tenacibaculum sp. Bg11-29]|uniref:hypothetical protein n=1 Tax=Tenacibaculum sp. Bg11-29 TaxID=2058306 RepID=UPI000C33545E|nr:hypothetical protein [Tenacibaculum sp. Bg11-29]PKH50044.1 hypothetical protein CXF68_04690 [Tenacibaculum sp. Bg11-29]
MNTTLKLLPAILLMVSLVNCSSNDEIITNGDNTSSSTLEAYLKANADYVHSINGFYIVGSAKKPSSNETTSGTTGKDVFEDSVRLFSNFLDQDNNGIIDDDKKELNKRLSKTMLFVSGPLIMVDKISAASEVTGKGLYGMSMQTDNWPYIKKYNGKGWSVNKLYSSTWRPLDFNALWEEVFHTVTEAFSRVDKEFAFSTGGALRKYMDDDITEKTYDISVQNAEENGNYDKVTAVNEYIHQIWAINFAGHANKLNMHQEKALKFMKNKGVPMKIIPSYAHVIGTKIK